MVATAAVASVAAASRNCGTCTGRQRRMGCSINHHEIAATATVAERPNCEERHARQTGAFPVEHKEDRPVPEVDAVGDHPEPHQRRKGQHARDEPALLQRHRSDDENRRDRDHDQQSTRGIPAHCPSRSAPTTPSIASPMTGSSCAIQRPQRDRICVP